MARWMMMLAAASLMVGCGRATTTSPSKLAPLQPVTSLTTTAGGEGRTDTAETEADRRAADPTRQRDGQGGLPR